MRLTGNNPEIIRCKYVQRVSQGGIVLFAVGTFLCSSGGLAAQQLETPERVIDAVVGNERKAEAHRNYFSYISEEQSARTKGHRWTEKVVESEDGKIRRLIKEDGKPLEAERSSKEMDRLKMLAEHPKLVAKQEQASKEDDDRLQRLLALLPKVYSFEDGGLERGFRRIIFHPNPTFSPASFEERIVHSMSGSILVSSQELRLHAIDARLTEDVSWGFGMLARLNSGGHILMVREEKEEGQWKTTFLETALDGKAIFLKTINLRQNTVHTKFKPIPKLSVPQAVSSIATNSD